MKSESSIFNNRIRQVLIILMLIALSLLFIVELNFLIPGFLGAITVYIISRDRYLKLTEGPRKWNKKWTAVLFIATFTLCIGIPVYFSVHLLSSKVREMMENSDKIVEGATAIGKQLKAWLGMEVFTEDSMKTAVGKAGNYIPGFLNGSAIMLGNFLLILFLSYFMLTNRKKMEKALQDFIPLKDKNIDILAKETKSMVRSNAIGIPLISLIQGAFATLGYWIFGVEDFVLWGFVTGIFSFFPVVGTTLIWLPLVIFMFSTGETNKGIGLLIYSAVVIANVDYLARISLLRRIGEVHPVVTIIGVILGLKLFGFWGFIFGPLLVSYLLLMLKIYVNEFGSYDPDEGTTTIIQNPDGSTLPLSDTGASSGLVK